MLIYHVTSEKGIFYRIDRKGSISMSSKSFKNSLNFLQKRILILGKEWVYFLKKRYPVLSENELAKAISFEVRELFPLREPEWFFFTGKRGETFIEVNLFAWEKELTKKFEKEFAFNYIIPEELLFNSQELTLFFFKRKDRVLIVLSERGTFLNSLYLKFPFSCDEVIVFMRSSGLDLNQVRSVWVYGFSEKELFSLLPSELKSKVSFRISLEKDIPLFLKNFPFKYYRVKREISVNLEDWILRCARISLMVVIALQLNLMFSNWEYERGIKALQEDIQRFDEKIREKLSLIPLKGKPNNFEEQERLQAFRELEEELNSHKKNSVYDGLSVLDEIAKLLPDGSKITYFELKEKQLSLSLEAKDLFEVLTNFRKSSYFSEVKFSGMPSMDTRTKTYRFRLDCRLK